MKLLHPRDSKEKKAALLQAAYSPGLFAAIKEQWPDGFVSENALRSYLMRNNFSSVAVAPAVSSYLETYSILQQEGVTESHGASEPLSEDVGGVEGDEPVPKLTTSGQARALPPPPIQTQTGGMPMSEGERVVFVEEGGPANYLKLVANGELDETLLEALEDFIKHQKKRLTATAAKLVN